MPAAEDSPSQPPSPSTRTAAVELLLASFVVLFQELALIRWLPVEIRVVAYFPNLILIAAFLGLGAGSLRARRTSLLWLWPASLLALVGAARLLSGVAFTSESESEYLWLLYYDLPEGAPVVEGIHLPLVLFFCLSAATFVPLGQFVGRRLEVFRTRSSALWGYALDLGGSLLGVVGFGLASYAGWGPLAWFLPVALLGLVLVRHGRFLRWGFPLLATLVLLLVQGSVQGRRFSPYYALEAVPREGTPAVDIRANGSLHQVAVDLVSDEQRWQVTREGYRLPYRMLGRPIRRALVLGAGTGNDVAVLLDQGAGEVHAVEIDPEILALGREMHPNRPYADSRVVVHNTDARSFLNETELRFDVVVFGTLDSMTRLSALSNVRLDNFVYTLEGLAAARRILTEDGGLILYFRVAEPYIFDHLGAMLAATFGTLPRTHRGEYSLFNVIFMAGPAFQSAEAPAEASGAWFLQEDFVRGYTPTDDWPYLYLRGRGLDAFYASMMLILGLLAVGTVLWASPGMRASLRGRSGVDVEMFLYGFAFLLLETKFITSMNLAWGATWITSAVVFAAILATVLAGTVLMELRPVSLRTAGTGLAVSLLLVWIVPTSAVLSTSPPVRLALSLVYVGLPVFFASLCFAVRFKVRGAADLAFGWNLLGAVVGGLTEFLSMWTGFRSLTLIALGAYLLALWLAAREGAESHRREPLRG